MARAKLSCGICLEEGVTDLGTLNSCDHCFCFPCIDKWLKIESRCPTCKKEVSNLTRKSVSDAGLRGVTKGDTGNRVNKRRGKTVDRVAVTERRQRTEHDAPDQLDTDVDDEEWEEDGAYRCFICGEGGRTDPLMHCQMCDDFFHQGCVGAEEWAEHFQCPVCFDSQQTTFPEVEEVDDWPMEEVDVIDILGSYCTEDNSWMLDEEVFVEVPRRRRTRARAAAQRPTRSTRSTRQTRVAPTRPTRARQDQPNPVPPPTPPPEVIDLTEDRPVEPPQPTSAQDQMVQSAWAQFDAFRNPQRRVAGRRPRVRPVPRMTTPRLPRRVQFRPEATITRLARRQRTEQANTPPLPVHPPTPSQRRTPPNRDQTATRQLPTRNQAPARRAQPQSTPTLGQKRGRDGEESETNKRSRPSQEAGPSNRAPPQSETNQSQATSILSGTSGVNEAQKFELRKLKDVLAGRVKNFVNAFYRRGVVSRDMFKKITKVASRVLYEENRGEVISGGTVDGMARRLTPRCIEEVAVAVGRLEGVRLV